jgi:hypothetical protein
MPRSAHPMAQAAPIPVEAPVIKTNWEATTTFPSTRARIVTES